MTADDDREYRGPCAYCREGIWDDEDWSFLEWGGRAHRRCDRDA